MRYTVVRQPALHGHQKLDLLPSDEGCMRLREHRQNKTRQRCRSEHNIDQTNREEKVSENERTDLFILPCCSGTHLYVLSLVARGVLSHGHGSQLKPRTDFATDTSIASDYLSFTQQQQQQQRDALVATTRTATPPRYF